MFFIEQELKKILGYSQYGKCNSFIGQACYVRVNEEVRLRLEFSKDSTTTYDGLKMVMLNRKEGIVDSNIIKFADIWGKKAVSNPSFKEGIFPQIWTYGDRTEWYVYKPMPKDYRGLAGAIDSYMSMFQETEIEQGPQMEL